MIENFEFDEYVSYMRGLAESHTAIQHTEQTKHFYRINIEDALDSLTALKSPIVLLESFEGRITGPNDDQLYDQIRCGFMIVETVKQGKHADQDEVLKRTRGLMRDFISKMRHDRKTGTEKWLRFLKVDSIQYFKVGPLMVDKYGWLCEFTVDTPINLSYNPAIWQ